MFKIASAFPGCGKSTLFKETKDITPIFKISDSDSSKFSKESLWYLKYVDHLENLQEQNYIVLASTHNVVLKELLIRNLPLMVFYPSVDRKEEFLKNYELRGSDTNFVQLMDKQWDNFINDITTTIPEDKRCELKPGQFLSLSKITQYTT